jgi:hypothetical protein
VSTCSARSSAASATNLALVELALAVEVDPRLGQLPAGGGEGGLGARSAFSSSIGSSAGEQLPRLHRVAHVDRRSTSRPPMRKARSTCTWLSTVPVRVTVSPVAVSATVAVRTGRISGAPASSVSSQATSEGEAKDDQRAAGEGPAVGHRWQSFSNAAVAKGPCPVCGFAARAKARGPGVR